MNLPFVLANERLSKARDLTRTWNRHSDQFVPWEWVEEALIAAIRAEQFLGRDIDKGMEQVQRCREYANRLPATLRNRIGV